MTGIAAVEWLEVLVLGNYLTDSLSTTLRNMMLKWNGLPTGGRVHIL